MTFEEEEKRRLLYVIFNFSTCHSALLQQNEIQNKNWKSIFLFFNSSLYLWVDDLPDFLLNTNSTITMSLLFSLWLRFMRWYKSVMEIFTFFINISINEPEGKKTLLKWLKMSVEVFFFLVFFKCLFDWMRFFSVCVYIQSSFMVSFKSKGLHKASSDVRKVHAN